MCLERGISAVVGYSKSAVEAEGEMTKERIVLVLSCVVLAC